MRHIRRSGLATVLVTGGALALSAGYVHADSHAAGVAENSPGVGSGNGVQLPVHVPVNVCGNTVNVVGLLNPAFGNTCANKGGGSHKDLPGTSRGTDGHGSGNHGSGNHGGHGNHGGNGGHGGHGHDGGHGNHGGNGGGSHNGAGSHNGGGADADGVAAGSPGLISGNGIQLPVDLPVNISGNSVNVVGIGNPVFGNSSTNDSVEPPHAPAPVQPGKPVTPAKPAPGPQVERPTETKPQTSSVALADTGADVAGIAVPASAALLLGGALLYRRFRAPGDAS
ncbi:chaplin [Streptomyces purpureus]|uniref:Chaplin domain-containing protein n=1 Tax=Streptomyces purpureus TaxID=1951 RepID=A0A918GYX9_9ACTN|nr:chaplin [Streptomyces purpureus]GGT23961.1 hypothetical protein GCM10014713_16200 [Streptomyces purpureus]